MSRIANERLPGCRLSMTLINLQYYQYQTINSNENLKENKKEEYDPETLLKKLKYQHYPSLVRSFLVLAFCKRREEISKFSAGLKTSHPEF